MDSGNLVEAKHMSERFMQIFLNDDWVMTDFT